jgi:hypothetical protein
MNPFASSPPQGDPSGVLPSGIGTALELLREARQAAGAVQRECWQFAVEAAQLRAAGLTSTDLRWLLCQGYAERRLSLPPGRGGPGGYLLAWTGPLSFCAGLFVLALLPPLGVAVPRWLILAHGVGSALLMLLALRLSRPWRQLQAPAHQPGYPRWNSLGGGAGASGRQRTGTGLPPYFARETCCERGKSGV